MFDSLKIQSHPHANVDMKDTSLNENCPIKNQMYNTQINASNSNDMVIYLKILILQIII